MGEKHPESDTPIDFSSFDGTAANSLRREAVFKNGVLMTFSETELYGLPLFGPKRVGDTKTYLKKRGLSLRDSDESFSDRSAVVYGQLANTPVEALIIHLSIPLLSQKVIATTPYIKQLHESGLVVIGDFSRFTKEQIRSMLGYRPDPIWHSICEWLSNAGIQTADQ